MTEELGMIIKVRIRPETTDLNQIRTEVQKAVEDGVRDAKVSLPTPKTPSYERDLKRQASLYEKTVKDIQKLGSIFTKGFRRDRRGVSGSPGSDLARILQALDKRGKVNTSVMQDHLRKNMIKRIEAGLAQGSTDEDIMRLEEKRFRRNTRRAADSAGIDRKTFKEGVLPQDRGFKETGGITYKLGNRTVPKDLMPEEDLLLRNWGGNIADLRAAMTTIQGLPSDQAFQAVQNAIKQVPDAKGGTRSNIKLSDLFAELDKQAVELVTTLDPKSLKELGNQITRAERTKVPKHTSRPSPDPFIYNTAEEQSVTSGYIAPPDPSMSKPGKTHIPREMDREAVKYATSVKEKVDRVLAPEEMVEKALREQQSDIREISRARRSGAITAASRLDYKPVTPFPVSEEGKALARAKRLQKRYGPGGSFDPRLLEQKNMHKIIRMGIMDHEKASSIYADYMAKRPKMNFQAEWMKEYQNYINKARYKDLEHDWYSMGMPRFMVGKEIGNWEPEEQKPAKVKLPKTPSYKQDLSPTGMEGMIKGLSHKGMAHQIDVLLGNKSFQENKRASQMQTYLEMVNTAMDIASGPVDFFTGGGGGGGGAAPGGGGAAKGAAGGSSGAIAAGAAGGAAMAGIGFGVEVVKKLQETVKKILHFLIESSPRLKAYVKLLLRGIQLFLRPIGDMLATFVRPFAKLLIKLNRSAMLAGLAAGSMGTGEYLGAYMSTWIEGFFTDIWPVLEDSVTTFVEELLPALAKIGVNVFNDLGTDIIDEVLPEIDPEVFNDMLSDIGEWVVTSIDYGSITGLALEFSENALASIDFTAATGTALDMVQKVITAVDYTQATDMALQVAGNIVSTIDYTKVTSLALDFGTNALASIDYTRVGDLALEVANNVIMSIDYGAAADTALQVATNLINEIDPSDMASIGGDVAMKLVESIPEFALSELPQMIMDVMMDSIKNVEIDLGDIGGGILSLGGLIQMDSGGISNGPTPVVFGEKRREVISPLSELKSMIGEVVAEKISSTLSATVVIPGKAMSDAIKNGVDTYYRTQVVLK